MLAQFRQLTKRYLQWSHQINTKNHQQYGTAATKKKDVTNGKAPAHTINVQTSVGKSQVV